MRVPSAAPVSRPEPRPTGVLLVGVAFCLIAGLSAAQGTSPSQPAAVTATMGAGPARAASGAARPASAASNAPRAARSPTSPLWSELTAPQQQALGPLAGTWPTISEAQKR